MTRLTRRRKLSPKPSGRTGGIVHFPAKARIFDAEHPSRRVYLLNSGQVRLWSGEEAIVEQLAPGAFFGEKCFLSPGRYEQIAITLSPVVASTYRRAELLHCVQQDRRFAVRLLKNLALRMDRYEQAIRDFVTEQAEYRLARLLSRFTPSRPASGWIRLPLRATNLELAQMVGTTPWRVSHFLNHFQRLGWLSRRQEGLWIDPEALNKFLKLRHQK